MYVHQVLKRDGILFARVLFSGSLPRVRIITITVSKGKNCNTDPKINRSHQVMVQ
jgi:hypothetical protein